MSVSDQPSFFRAGLDQNIGRASVSWGIAQRFALILVDFHKLGMMFVCDEEYFLIQSSRGGCSHYRPVGSIFVTGENDVGTTLASKARSAFFFVIRPSGGSMVASTLDGRLAAQFLVQSLGSGDDVFARYLSTWLACTRL